jgi:arginine decarboxylase
MLILGNRVPYEYFITKGKGESNAGSTFLPYETGSYDAALNDAGIQNCNVIEYTSVMPVESKEITKEAGRNRLQWGEVLECIKAQANGEKGAKISVGVITTSVHAPSGKYLGGFACEYSGSLSREDVEMSLIKSIEGMIARRGYGTATGGLKIYKDNITSNGYKIHPGDIFIYESLDVKQKHGSVLAAICFVSYKYPTLSNSNSKSKNKNTHKHTKKNKTRK